ncbi:MAG: hypothetical protein AAB320_01260 [Elusimicrobiota bacterium]
MKSGLLAAALSALLTLPAAPLWAQPEAPPAAVKIKPKARLARDADAPETSRGGGGGLIQPDVSLLDAPTSSVLDYGGYSSQTRFFAAGGLLETVSFGVFHKLNIGGSLNIDGLIGNDRTVRARAPGVQVKYRFYEGDRYIPSFSLGFDAQGYQYSTTDKRYNQRQRGFYVVGSQELGLPGLQAHPSLNISDFDTNAFFASFPFSYNIRDKVLLMMEWDNVNNFRDSRINSGLRVYMTPNFHLDFGVRGIGQGGRYPDGSPRGPERIVQLRYAGNF